MRIIYFGVPTLSYNQNLLNYEKKEKTSSKKKASVGSNFIKMPVINSHAAGIDIGSKEKLRLCRTK